MNGERQQNTNQIAALLAWMGLSVSAGVIGAIASSGASAFYATLERPSWAPPAWLFAPVWTVLYLVMGVAAWLVWRRRSRDRITLPMALFIMQLSVNALWSWIFFFWHRGGLAFVDIVVLWVLVVATAIAFARLTAIAGLLLAPYLGWVTFAAALNYSIWRMNPLLLGA